MKLDEHYLMTDMGDETILVPIGAAEERFRGIVRLNDTAAFIVRCLRSETSADKIVDAMLAEYEVERTQAEQAVAEVIAQLQKLGAIAD